MAESKAEAAVDESNRRVDPRYPAAVIPAITAMRLSPGEAVSLVNISAIGGGGSLQYQSAIAFEGRMDLPVEESALPPSAVAAPAPVADAPPPKKGKAAAAAPPPPPPAPTRVYNRW